MIAAGQIIEPVFLERLGPCRFRRPEHTPPWLEPLISEASSDVDPILEFDDPATFSGAFAEETETHWQTSNSPIGSGLVNYRLPDGGEVYLSMRGVVVGQTRGIGVEYVGASYLEALQTSEESRGALVNLAYNTRRVLFRQGRHQNQDAPELQLEIDFDHTGRPIKATTPSFFGARAAVDPDPLFAALPESLRCDIEHRLRSTSPAAKADFQYRFEQGPEQGRLYRLRLKQLESGTRLQVLDITSHFEGFAAALLGDETDPLTGLPNRTAIARRIESALRRAGPDSAHSCAVLFIDLDDFKPINDTHGHHVGDRLLQSVGDRLTQITRSIDGVSRWGGDEFVVLIEDLRHEDDSHLVAAKVVRSLAEPFDIDGIELSVGASVGVAVAPRDGTDLDLLLTRADAAMYKAKSNGRGQFWSADEDDDLVEHRAHARELLDQALEEDQLAVRLCPQLTAENESAYGFEVVPYWMHPERGLLNPALLLKSAGRSHEPPTNVSLWALEQSLELLGAPLPKTGSQRSTERPVLSLEIGNQCLTQETLDTFIDRLSTYAGGLDDLELLLSETVLTPSAKSFSPIDRLRETGVRLALVLKGRRGLDPLSIGQAGLSRVVIDNSLVARLIPDDSARTIAAGICGVANGLSIPVLARRVDSQKQLEILQKCGCNHFQGYRAGEPLPAPPTGTTNP